jgi:6-phosphogluconolactonase
VADAIIPGLSGEQVVSATADEAAHALVSRLGAYLRQRLQVAASAHLALSGASSGALVCDVLATSGKLTHAEWSRIHVWMVDERSVPDSDPQLNFALVRDRLAPRVGLPRHNLHPMPVMQPDGDRIYERDLDAALAPQAGRFDMVVLGMGADGHTASLFPHSPAQAERARRVVTNDGDTVAPPRPRMTLTYPTLNSARLIAVLATSASKRPALTRLATGLEDFHSLPIAGIQPSQDSTMVWYLDQEALPAG